MKSCPILLALVSASLFLSCQRDPVGPKPVEINYHFATITEGQQRLLANTEYYDRLTQNDLDWKARKTGATLDELKAIGQASVLDFSEEDKAVIDEAVGYIEGRLTAMGAISLPFPDHDIVFIKTNMMEESGAPAGYTHKTEIYLDATRSGLCPSRHRPRIFPLPYPQFPGLPPENVRTHRLPHPGKRN